MSDSALDWNKKTSKSPKNCRRNSLNIIRDTILTPEFSHDQQSC